MPATLLFLLLMLAAPLGLLLIAAAVVIALRLGPSQVRFLRPIVVVAIVGILAEWCFELLRFHTI